MSPIVNPAQRASQEDSGALRQGERLQAEVVNKGDIAVLRMKGAEYPVRYQGESPKETTFKVEILKTYPLVEVRVFPDDVKAPQGTVKLAGSLNVPVGSTVQVTVVKNDNGIFLLQIGDKFFTGRLLPDLPGSGTFQAKVLSTSPVVIQPDRNTLPLSPEMRSELMLMFRKDHSAIAREIGVERLHIVTAESIRNIIKNSGLFMENKLATGESVAGDRKAVAAQKSDQPAWDSITRMQLAALILQEGIFSFFDMEDLTEEGIIPIRRSDQSAGLYIQMNFTVLGEIVVSIVPSHMGIYKATVRTAEDISEKLRMLSIKGVTVRWAKLRSEDTRIFDIKGKLIAKLGHFDIIV